MSTPPPAAAPRRRRPTAAATVDTRVARLLTDAASAVDAHAALAHLDSAAALEAQAKRDADVERAAADPLVTRLVARAKTAHAAGDRDRAERLLDAAHAAAGRGRLDALTIRRQALPMGILGLLWAGAAVGHLIPGAGPTLAGLYLTLAVVWWFAQGRRADWTDRPARARRRRHAAACAAAGAGWLYWGSAAGVTGWHAAALWIAGYALAAPAWGRAHIPTPALPEPPAPPVTLPTRPRVEITERGSNIAGLWARWVAGRGGPVEGSRLTDREDLERGREGYTVHLIRGRQTRDDLDTRKRRIASAMGMSAADLEFATHPDGDHRARLIVTLDRDNAATTVTYPGPEACYDPATGMTYWGAWPDGQLMPWDAFHPERGAFSGVILGASRSGKSTLVEQLCCTWMNTGLVTVWMIDPQDGASLPTLAKHADWPVVGTAKGRAGTLLRAVDIVGKTRTQLIGAMPGRKVHPISRRAPALFVVIDECHFVFDPKIVGPVEAAHNIAVCERIARSYAKAGIGVILLSQNTDQGVFGHSEDLRMNAWNLNGIIMRLPSNIAGNLVPNFTGNAKTLPPFGYAYRLGAGARDISGRAFDPGKGDALDGYYANAPHLELEAAVRYKLHKDIGAAYDNRHRVAEDAAIDVAADFLGDDMDPGLIAAIAEDDPDLAARLQDLAARRPLPTLTGPSVALPAATGSAPSTALGLRPAAWVSLSPAPIPDDTAPDEIPDGPASFADLAAFAAGLAAQQAGDDPDAAMKLTQRDIAETFPSLSTPAGRDIYRLISHGVSITREIHKQSTYSETTVHRVLKGLVADGLITKSRHGRYELIA